MEISRDIVITSLLCAALEVGAQQSFTDRITAHRNGEGVVVLHQDATLTALVNGTALPKKAVATPKPADTPSTTTASATTTTQPQTETTRVVHGTTKMRGYRVQVYSGGNSRKAKHAAEQMARRVKETYPEVSVYTQFASPRWICRVGDFRTSAEASELLSQMKSSGTFPQAVIVKTTVQVPY